MKFENFKDLLALLLSFKLSPPPSYKEKVSECRKILSNDLTGLISPIIKFAIVSASKVKFRIRTNNDNLDELLENTLEKINSEFVGKINIGLDALKKDFFRSYWESGMALVRVHFNDVDGLLLPVRAFVVDSASVVVEGDEKVFGDFSYSIENGNSEVKKLVNNEANHYFVYKDCNMYKKYPTPPLIARGIYANYQIKQNVKLLQTDYLRKVVSLLWVILKGDRTNPKFKKEDAEKIVQQLQQVLKEAKDIADIEKRIPALVARYDTQIDIKTPEMERMLTEDITRSIDKDILTGLGFVTVIEGLSTRRDIVLNPKPFIHSVLDTVFMFKQFLKDLVYVIAQKNAEHQKYFPTNFKYRIVTTPLNSFWTDDMMDIMRVLSDRGLLSIKTTLENFDIDFEEERRRREKEAEEGDEIVFYPRVLQNLEQQVSPIEMTKLDIEPEEEIKEEGKGKKKAKQPEPNVTTPEKDVAVKIDNKLSADYVEFIKHLSPYEKWSDLPPRLRKTLRTIRSPRLRRAWLETFNNAWVYYNEINPDRADELAARTAWKIVKLMGKKTKNGWILKEEYKRK